MAKHLLVVESPAKARTIKRYLGPEFDVIACYGHIRDLRPKEGAVEPEHGFAMHYEIVERNAKHVAAIAKAMRKADALFLATDPDREGEAISWHIVEVLRERKALDGKPVHRVVFHEITKRAVTDALDHSRELASDLVNAQQARRALDYLVGFNLSPLLWKKVRRGLSAGRVQSPALRMIAEREEEIERFVTREYWSIEADLKKDEQAFVAKLVRFEGAKVEQFTITREEDARAAEAKLAKLAAGRLTVSDVKKKQRRRNPTAPFSTSTLQQEAARKLGFTAQRTMRVAQQLYEGVGSTGEAGGLISYMRTDSVTLSHDALAEIRAYIGERYGEHNVPAKARVFKTKAKNAQEAHEAIRPTSVARAPEGLRGGLDRDQHRLYELIWKRTVASQMIPATIDTVSVDLAGGAGNTFRATGSTVVDPGFLAVYEEGVDNAARDEGQSRLPALSVGEVVTLERIRPEQHFTEPPPRYTEATLVKTLEEYGIGRPSTYAAIISTLQQREYVVLEKRRFKPTDVGRVVSRFLTQHFSKYVDYDFTARLEDDLDAISRGEKEWVPVMDAFWGDFKDQIDTKDRTVTRSDVTQELLDERCPECGSALATRLGRRGRFIGCTAFPECGYTRDLNGEEPGEKREPEVVEGRTCPDCGSALHVKEGRYGKFIGCSNYPACRHIEPLEKPTDTGIRCPACGAGNLLKKKSRKGKVFYSCATYPTCDYAVWNEPVAEPCPQCQWPVLTIKTTRRRGREKVCPQKECDFATPDPEVETTVREAG